MAIHPHSDSSASSAGKPFQFAGTLLVSDTPLSFWGGVDPASGEVMDEHHSLKGQIISNTVLAIPGSRGSCSGSGTLLELVTIGKAPAALVVSEAEEILLLGALVADRIFNISFPIFRIDKSAFDQLASFQTARIADDTLFLDNSESSLEFRATRLDVVADASVSDSLTLGETDRQLLSGECGQAAQVAMQIILKMAAIQGATELLSITQAHIDSCIYHGKSSLQFAERLVAWGARVKVPTTLNSISVDQRRWREQGIDPAFGNNASALGDAYMAMGAMMSYTCAPYLLDTAPVEGEQIVWAESNAVAYANSVIGARTQKYPDFLDVCIALTGRAPLTGAHQDEGRRPNLRIHVPLPDAADDTFWPLLGYHIGLISPNSIPLILGLEESTPTSDDLKAFSAAFATSSSAPMFHIAGITPETRAGSIAASEGDFTGLAEHRVSLNDLQESWQSLNTATTERVDMVCLGNPHFSLSECRALASLCEKRKKSEDVALLITLGRAVLEQCRTEGLLAILDAFGAQCITDTCWCMVQEPVIPATGSVLMTNSGKYAHYAPGLVSRTIHFGSLAQCVEAACTGSCSLSPPHWLSH